MEIVISSYCRITSKSFIINGKEIVIPPQGSAPAFLTEAYKLLGINYPKFHKMDALCKLGIIATEAALQGSSFLVRNDPQNVGIILSNKASSLDTDRNHQQSINSKDHYFPSPSVFVYTLPNIVIGEIAIKYKITGENAFFVTDSFNPELLLQQNTLLLKQNVATAVISGWVDYDNGTIDALIYLAEIVHDSIKNSNFKPLNELTIKQLY